MVYGIAAKIIRETGAYLIPRAVRTFNKYDKTLYAQVFGRTRGRGIRHGRDAGLAIGGSIRSSMENAEIQPRTLPPPRKQSETRGRYRNQRGYKRGKYCPPCGRRRQSNSFNT